MRHFLFISTLALTPLSLFAKDGKTYYQEIPAGESPFKNEPAPQVDAANQQHQTALQNSGLYANPSGHNASPTNASPSPAPSNYNSPASPTADASMNTGGTSAATAPKTHWDSTGHEIDTESGLATGNYDPSKARSSASPPAGRGTSSDSNPTTETADNKGSTAPENTPSGYESNPQEVEGAVSTIANTIQSAPGQNAKFFVPGFAQLQAGAKAYVGSQKACIQGQANASTWCRDETNPELQKTLMIMNAATAAMNSIAVKDACSTFSKVMSMAQLGMTAYTLSCGAMKKKCDISCGKASKALEALRSGLTRPYSCMPIDPAAPSGCMTLLGKFESALLKLKTTVEKELNPGDRKAVVSKTKLCAHTYTGLLASAGLSLISIANSVKQGQSCDDESNGSGNGGGASPTEVAGVNLPTSATSTESESSSISSTTTSESASTATTAPTNSAESTSPTLNNEGSNTPIFARNSGTIKPRESSPYAAYLPGGEKDPQRNIAGESAWKKEVTSSGGKSNWQKARERYKDFEALP